MKKLDKAIIARNMKLAGLSGFTKSFLKENINKNDIDFDEDEFSDDDVITAEDIELIKQYKKVNDEIKRLKSILANLDKEIEESGINLSELDDIDL